jgi:phospholipid/cholesterol/gamma-HCH transport system ATP-binding protein
MATPTLPSENPVASVATPSGYAIEFDNVSIAFDENVVLKGISFQLAHGETKAVFGVAGSGKSTMLKLAMGLMRPDSGRIFVLGEEVSSMSERELFELRRRVGIVFQESALFDSLKVYENVAFRLMEEGTPADEIERRVREV